MPLVRYEIRNEHSLANPQLYRTAAKDDPEGLLEGVAMAGLVGIVRQLGDLAEFAAEVFRDLHEEVMATASRGHDLLARVQQLEAEMPIVEKALLSETNQLRFAYTPGSEWHASIRNDQNHCTQGDLPRFIRNSYEECRGPPRLFLLDKFDVAGAGACLKRYTDPSFFRTEWASSELMKAERVQRDKRARREKKKGRRRRNVEGKDSIPVDQFHTRFSHELSKELMQPDQAHPRMRHAPVSGRSEEESAALENMNYNENLNALSRHLAEAQGPSRDVISSSKVSPAYTQEAPNNDLVDELVPAVSEMARSSHSTDLKSESVTSMDNKDVPRKWEETGSGAAIKDEMVLQAQQDAGMDVLDDGASEGEQFLDALTTMESEADTDSEPGVRQDRDAERVFDARGRQSTSQEDSRLPVLFPTSTDEKMNLSVDQTQTTSQEDMRAPGLYQTSTGEKATQSLEQPLTTSQEDMSAPGLYQISTGEKATQSLEKPLTTSQEDIKAPELCQTSTGEKATLSREQLLTTSQEDLTVPGYQLSTAEKVNLLEEQSQTSLQEDLSMPGYQTSTAENVNLSVEQSQTSSQADLSLPGYQPSTGEKVTVPVEQSATTSQEDLRMPELKQMSAEKIVTPLVEQSPTSRLLDSSGENPSSNIVNGQDVKGISSSTTSVHVRRHSTDSISSQSFRKFKHGQLFEKPFESFVTRPKLFIPVKDERGVKVSKMVAAFERGSLEHIHDKEPVKETQGIIRESTSLESVAERVNRASVEVENVGISEDHKSKRNSLQDSRSPLLVSPASAYSTSTKGSSTKSRGSPSPPTIRVEGRSFSRHVSLDSLDSLPDSPIFSALHSPMSPVRTTRNILSSPDSHSVGFSTELLSPGSPTSVPILAHSPTSRIVPPSFFSLDRGGHETFQSLSSSTVEESFNHASLSTSPTELPLTDQMEELSETASPSTTILKIIENSSTSLLMPVEDSNDRGSSLSVGSPDALPTSTLPTVSPEFKFLDNSEDLNAKLSNVLHEVHTSVAKHEPFTSPISPQVEHSLDAVLSTSQSTVDDIAIPSMLNNDAPDHEPSKVGGSVLMEPIIPPPSPLPSASLNDFSAQNFQKDKREQLRPSSVFLRSDEFASKVSHSEPTHELPFRPRKAGHKRFPSLPPSEKTSLDFVPASFSKLLQDPLATSKRVPDIQVSTSKFLHDLPSPSLFSRTLHDRPLPVSRAAHRRFPSFPPSEKAALEFASASSSRPLQDHQTSSAIPSKPAARAQVPASKFVHSLPSPSAPLRTFNALPAPIPSNFEPDILPPAASPSRTLHELPPPPPPPLSVAKPSVVVDVQDALLDAIASHDKSTLKKVKTMQNPSLRKGDERSHLLEQIRAQSFNLRHTVVEKVDPPLPRPVTNINVAAILEKANAIRQAFAGSDEDDEDDDDWSDV